jgi:hypothetical protein
MGRNEIMERENKDCIFAIFFIFPYIHGYLSLTLSSKFPSSSSLM